MIYYMAVSDSIPRVAGISLSFFDFPAFSFPIPCIRSLIFLSPSPTPSLSRATEVISYLDRVHQQKKEGVKPSSPYLRLILEQARYTSQPKQEQEILKLIPSVGVACLCNTSPLSLCMFISPIVPTIAGS